jgi:hypothetical protein
MRTLLKNYDCILEHDFIAEKQAKEGEIVPHKNIVERVIFYKQTYDNNGYQNGCEKIVIEKQFLNELMKTINEIQSETKDLEFTFYF